MRSRKSRNPHPGARLSGIVLLDKPRGISSNQALQQARRLFGADKGGHTGSLDPLATGLLPICLGEATKIAGLLLGSRKAYETEALLGVTTSTDDAEGEVLQRRPVPALDDARIRVELAALVGRIRQVAPVYSAIKRGGERLYERVRRGETVEAPEREVDVQRFDLLEVDGARVRLHVECGSGTYVRSLVRDLGERLGCGAHVVALRRLWVEPFMSPTMHTLDELAARAAQGAEALADVLLPLEQGLAGRARVAVDAAGARKLRQGQALECAEADGPCVALDEQGRAVALAEIVEGRLRAVRVFSDPDPA
ncbi:MAG: tRNA pseudouridine(55) synthase TruB [Lysobacteraceae bacterium]|nr:MAG: tRNA pseudouridine(55) synthase TruB [Xanthomonadaceae bacterium]